MAQSSQSVPSTTMNIGGSNHVVNLRDYLNMRVAPFLKKAITESLDTSPEFPLQWLGEHLIHQSMLYEGNPDRTNIKERFLYTFDAPVRNATPPPPPPPYVDTAVEMSTAVQPSTDEHNEAAPIVNGTAESQNYDRQQLDAMPDAQTASHVDTQSETLPQQNTESATRDVDMEGTS